MMNRSLFISNREIESRNENLCSVVTPLHDRHRVELRSNHDCIQPSTRRAVVDAFNGTAASVFGDR
jgi:hypothetical protein